MSAQWTQEDALNFEAARECITAYMAIFSAEIYAENSLPKPDATKLADLNSHRDRLFDERKELRLTDYAEIERIRSEYGSAVKASREAYRAKVAA